MVGYNEMCDAFFYISLNDQWARDFWKEGKVMQFDIEPEEYEYEAIEPIDEEYDIVVRWGNKDLKLTMHYLPRIRFVYDNHYVSLPIEGLPLTLSYYPAPGFKTKEWSARINLYPNYCMYKCLCDEFPDNFISNFTGFTPQDVIDDLYKSIENDYNTVSEYYQELIGPMKDALNYIEGRV